jgi:hypothetical protein
VEWLALDSCKITDVGLGYIQDMTSLTRLSLESTAVSRESESSPSRCRCCSLTAADKVAAHVQHKAQPPGSAHQGHPRSPLRHRLH